MTEVIGVQYPTAIPSLADTADIQEALRIYHYGGTALEFSPTEPDPTNLIEDSIAYHLYNLQNQINNFDAGVSLSAWSSKGVLISATEPSTPRALDLGSNGQVLTVNTATATGLEWRVPEVTLINTVTLTNKTLTSPKISDGGVRFLAASPNSYITNLIIAAPTANRTITLPDADTTLVGIDTEQELTNKIIGIDQLDGVLPVANGGTNAANVETARSNLQIFNAQTTVTGGDDRTSYSGKIYVVDPVVVGSTGASIDGANAGDLWFW